MTNKSNRNRDRRGSLESDQFLAVGISKSNEKLGKAEILFEKSQFG